MTTYVLQYEEYLENLAISDFQDEDEALAFHKKLEESENPRLSTFIAYSGTSFNSPRMSSDMRRAIYNIIRDEGDPELVAGNGEGNFVSGERLFIRMEIWMKDHNAL